MGAPFTFYEFFAGGGMARAGLGDDWRCLLANDFDRHKCETYRANWGGEDLVEGDVWKITADQLPRPDHGGAVDLAWASSPCQDLSLAGKRAGLSGARSSAFWGFWRLMEALHAQGRAPRTVVIENVTGLLTSHGGADFAALCAALDRAGYRFGALEIDAARFVPQSRCRMFLIATLQPVPVSMTEIEAVEPFHTSKLTFAFTQLSDELKARWIWWRVRCPTRSTSRLIDILEPDDKVAWSEESEVDRLLCLMGRASQRKLALARERQERVVGAVYRRMRVEDGVKKQRAEVRFDGLSGCLRTPGGGSSQQRILVIDEGRTRSRHFTPHELKRLMGLPEEYVISPRRTKALRITGDGVAVPVVAFLRAELLERL